MLKRFHKSPNTTTPPNPSSFATAMFSVVIPPNAITLSTLLHTVCGSLFQHFHVKSRCVIGFGYTVENGAEKHIIEVFLFRFQLVYYDGKIY